MNQPLLNAEDADRGLRRVAGQIVERHRGTQGLLLVGIRRGGVPVAESLAKIFEEQGTPVAVGSVDISLYRDDAATALPNPRIGPTKIPISIKGRRVILCDDVLFTGRTVRAAVDALLDYGRPEQIELFTVVERGGRELPIQADYSIMKVQLTPDDRVDVHHVDGRFAVFKAPLGSPTTPPPSVFAQKEDEA